MNKNINVKCTPIKKANLKPLTKTALNNIFQKNNKNELFIEKDPLRVNLPYHQLEIGPYISQ